MRELRNFDKNYDESGQLNLFTQTLAQFNGNMPLSSNFISDIDEYFQYRWRMDKNLAVSNNEDK